MATPYPSYLDFEVEIGPGAGREYPVAVIRSPAGEAHETMRFPYDELALENRLLRSGGKRRQVLSPDEQAVQDFGRDLFNALFTGEVRNRYDVSLERAWHAGQGLRVKLRIQPPELAALPWEFLYDPRQAEYVCLSRDTPLVRYLELPRPIPALGVTPPLRILGMIASPRDLPQLDEARERERVERALQGLGARGLAELTWLEGQTWRHLQAAMRGGPWHIFHFIGHGGFDLVADQGYLALADDEGNSHFLQATQLAMLLADHRPLRLALLNACEGARGGQRDVFSSSAAILVRRGIPAVLAMQYEITDAAAIELARAFYEALAEGMPVDAAVAEARKAVSPAVANTFEWGTPALTMRAPDGVLFQVEAAEARPAPPQPAERPARREAAPPAVEPAEERVEPKKLAQAPARDQAPVGAAAAAPRRPPAAEPTKQARPRLPFEPDYVKGMQFDQGYISPYFITDPETMEAVLEEPYVLIHEKKISAAAEIVPILEKLIQSGQRNLLMLAEDVDGEALATLVLNKLRGTFNVLAVKAPGFGDWRKAMLQDIAILTGGTVISEETGHKLETVTMADLGQCDKVVATKHDTTIVGGAGSEEVIKGRIDWIEAEIDISTSDHDKEMLQ